MSTIAFIVASDGSAWFLDGSDTWYSVGPNNVIWADVSAGVDYTNDECRTATTEEARILESALGDVRQLAKARRPT